MTDPADEALREADARIAWVLDHPQMSRWLKDALRAAIRNDPVRVINDLELLDHLLRRRAEAQIERLCGNQLKR